MGSHISVIIPAYNEEAYLPRTIAAVKAAEETLGEPVELIVADNTSTDRTAEVARSLGAQVVQVEKRCISAVRNGGAHAATGRYLVFVDADDCMSSNMLAEIRAVLESGIYIGGGVARTRYDRDSWGIRLTHGVVQFGLSLRGLSMFLFFTEADTFHSIGGFNEDLLCTEDYDFAQRLRRYGRVRGLRYKNLRSAYLVKSSRKFVEWGDWAFLTRPILAVRAVLNHRETVDRLWYEVRHPHLSPTGGAADSNTEETCADRVQV